MCIRDSDNIVADVLSRNPQDVLENRIPDGDEETEIYAVDIKLGKKSVEKHYKMCIRDSPTNSYKHRYQ